MSSFDDWYGILTPYYDDWDDDDEDKIDLDEDEYNGSEEEDWPEMDEEEKRLGFVPASFVHPDWPSDVLVPARYLCPEGEDWAYFGY